MHTFTGIEKIDTPALVINQDQVTSNIRNAIGMIGGDAARLRPHVKTNKSPDAARLMMAEGITKFKCATIAEAEMLAACGAVDILLAYQPLGAKLARFTALITAFPAAQFSCLTDHIDAAKAQSAAFSALGFEIPVFIDLNIGMNRTGIAPDAPALDLYRACADLPGIRPIGLQAYDGHLRQANIEDRAMACHLAFQPVAQLCDDIVAAGFPPPIVIAGGSLTFPIHAQRAEVECSPGTFIYWDKGYSDICPTQPFLPAAWLLTRVISLPDAAHICLDLGHKSVAAENPLASRVFFPSAPALHPVSQSEEHLVVWAGAGHTYQIGDLLWGIPFHICPTVALYEYAIVVQHGTVIGEWPTIGRNRRLHF